MNFVMLFIPNRCFTVFFLLITLCYAQLQEPPFYANSNSIGNGLANLQFSDIPQPKADKYNNIDAHRIIAPIINPLMDVFDQMQENARAKAQAEKIEKDKQDHPFSTSKSLWEMIQRLQKPSTTTTPQPPLIERLLQPYIEPWQKQLDDFSKDMAGITLIPTTTTTTTEAPTTTTTPNLLEKSLSVFFPSLRRKQSSSTAVQPTTTTTTQSPRLFDPELFDRLFFKREKRRAKRQANTFSLFTVPPPPPLFAEWEKPILNLSNPFKPNPLLQLFTTPSPPKTLKPLPSVKPPKPDAQPLPEPKFKLQDPFYNPLLPQKKSKLFDILAGGESPRILG